MTIGRGPAARVVTTLANVGPGDRVIDIGCGPGTAVREAARHGAIATGIDPDRTMLSFARLISAVRRARKVTWQQGSAESVPFPDSSATVVWALSSAHHWPEQSLGVAEATRLLAPGGQLLIAERVTRPGSRGHAAHGFTTEQGEQLANQLNAAGLVDVTSRTDRAGHKSLVVVTGSKKALASSS
jgi:ubiquinone/menaquinone biosynthesis C-methylase UbiE